VYFQANLYEQLGRMEEAARVLRDLAECFPKAKTHYDYAVALHKLKRHQDCLDVLEKEVLTRDPKLGAAHLIRGECLLELKRPADALAACEEAQRVDPERLADRLAECIKRAKEMSP
jgi:tetratricopeptide (TPR) repeat protein